MLVRSLVSIVNLAIFGVIIALEFLLPTLGGYLFWIIIAYFVGTLFFFRSPVMSRQITFGRPKPASTPTPLPSSSGGTPLSSNALGFCVHCGTLLSPGQIACPSCGRSQPVF
ncbi:MAG: zinc ribbon domain-containing protein [Thermoplasmata archaeon]|nr:zinc ribbon domain-containing protein [Thermoplasmata archaeon]